jgi:hypothetical protein
MGAAAPPVGDREHLVGVNRRNNSSGMVTPTSTSVGASTPSAIRARATSAISTVGTRLPVLRQRPSGTSVYRMPIRIAPRSASADAATGQPSGGSDGAVGRWLLWAGQWAGPRPLKPGLVEAHDDLVGWLPACQGATLAFLSRQYAVTTCGSVHSRLHPEPRCSVAGCTYWRRPGQWVRPWLARYRSGRVRQ